ncbi:YDG domain-containing protein, partial [Aphanothece stagnina]|uniref:YDG domain-containing protein n=1 Tax=Aphanothece stagnina TaxID=1004305 RepID=UPI00398EF3E7
AGEYQISGLVSGEGVTISQTAGVYDSKDVASASQVSAVLTGADYGAAAGTDLGNYSLDLLAEGNGAITPATLSVSLLDQSKVYDGTTTAVLGAGEYQISGLVSGEGVTISQTAGVYDSKDVASASQVSA